MSPSVTEGGSSNGGSSRNAYLAVDTSSSFKELLEDGEFVNSFKEYLDSHGCEECMKFWLICRCVAS